MAPHRFSELRNRDALNPPVALRNARIVATSGTGTGAVNFNIPADELLLTQDRYDAIDNAVGGKLEDVTALTSSSLIVGSAGVTVTGAAGSTMDIGMSVNMPGYSLTAGSITSDGKTVLRDGVAPAKSTLSSGSSEQLVHGRVYTLTVAEDTDLSALTVADDATAEIWVTYSAGAVTWPGTWVWGTDVFDSAASEDEPVFAAGEMYCVVVRHYAARGVTIATLSHIVK